MLKQKPGFAKFVQPNDLTDAQLNYIADQREAGTPWHKIEDEFGLCPNGGSYVGRFIRKRLGREIIKSQLGRKSYVRRPAPAEPKPKPVASHIEYDVAQLVRRGFSRQYIATVTRAPYRMIETAFQQFSNR